MVLLSPNIALLVPFRLIVELEPYICAYALPEPDIVELPPITTVVPLNVEDESPTTKEFEPDAVEAEPKTTE